MQARRISAVTGMPRPQPWFRFSRLASSEMRIVSWTPGRWRRGSLPAPCAMAFSASATTRDAPFWKLPGRLVADGQTGLPGPRRCLRRRRRRADWTFIGHLPDAQTPLGLRRCIENAFDFRPNGSDFCLGDLVDFDGGQTFRRGVGVTRSRGNHLLATRPAFDSTAAAWGGLLALVDTLEHEQIRFAVDHLAGVRYGLQVVRRCAAWDDDKVRMADGAGHDVDVCQAACRSRSDGSHLRLLRRQRSPQRCRRRPRCPPRRSRSRRLAGPHDARTSLSGPAEGHSP